MNVLNRFYQTAETSGLTVTPATRVGHWTPATDWAEPPAQNGESPIPPSVSVEPLARSKTCRRCAAERARRALSDEQIDRLLKRPAIQALIRAHTDAAGEMWLYRFSPVWVRQLCEAARIRRKFELQS